MAWKAAQVRLHEKCQPSLSRPLYHFKEQDKRLSVFKSWIIQCWDTNWECFYYWNLSSRKVSWLPPDDPEAVITDPERKSDRPIEERKRAEPSSDYSRGRSERPDRKRRTERERSPKRNRKRRNSDDDEFDPMDPSSYSDAPKGCHEYALLARFASHFCRKLE